MRVQYVALYKTGEPGKNYFRFVYVEYPDGMIPPPTIGLDVPNGGVHEFGLADTQEEIASLFCTTQQSVSRWMRNPEPPLRLVAA